MIFTGKNLAQLRCAVKLAIDELRTQIGLCPDVYEYADSLELLEEDVAVFERLLTRIDTNLEKENGRRKIQSNLQ